jgi:hypothetical protein
VPASTGPSTLPAPCDAKNSVSPRPKNGKAGPARRRYWSAAASTGAWSLNTPDHRRGTSATTSPIAPSSAAEAAAAVHATRRARAVSPRPIARPTIGTAATPMPKAIGTSMNSSRAPMP